jgi:hypothetical protein
MEGKRFGRLTVIKFEESNKKGRIWLCKCDCGNEVMVSTGVLNSGRKKSCGCLQKEVGERNMEISTKHGMKGTRIYRIWQNMKRRCSNRNCREYLHYGGRGISVCEDWANDFLSFYKWSIENGYTDELTIDRIDVNGNYEPSNCRWSTVKEQATNRRSNLSIEINGETKTVKEWCNISGITESTFYDRIHRGWQGEMLLSKPRRKSDAQ